MTEDTQYIPPLHPLSNRRLTPQSDLDLAMLTTESVWGKSEVNPELRERLSKYFLSQNEKGEQTVTISSLWGLLGYYTRDMRLANLNPLTGEMEYCRYYLDLAGDMLHAEMIEPFLICLSRVATMLELSQSKGGFLRRRLGTNTLENINRDMEPPKKSLFGIGKKNEPS